jgi:hypothetical protein
LFCLTSAMAFRRSTGRGRRWSSSASSASTARHPRSRSATEAPAARELQHLCSAAVFAGSPDGRESIDAAVSDASEDWEGRVYVLQELAPQDPPRRRRSGGAPHRQQGQIFPPLLELESKLLLAIKFPRNDISKLLIWNHLQEEGFRSPSAVCTPSLPAWCRRARSSRRPRIQ